MHRIFSSCRPSCHHIFAWNLCCFGSLIKDLSMQLFRTLFLKVEIWAKCCDRDLKVVISGLLVLRWRQWGSFFDFVVLINFWAAYLKQVNLVFIQRRLRSRPSGAVDVGSSLFACALSFSLATSVSSWSSLSLFIYELPIRSCSLVFAFVLRLVIPSMHPRVSFYSRYSQICSLGSPMSKDWLFERVSTAFSSGEWEILLGLLLSLIDLRDL